MFQNTLLLFIWVVLESNALGAGPPAVRPRDVVTVNAAEDAYVHKGYPQKNFSGDTKLLVNKTIFERQSFLKFNVTGLSGKTLKKACIKMKTLDEDGDVHAGAEAGYNYVDGYTVSRHGFSVYKTNKTDWSEGALTWKNKPGLGTHITKIHVVLPTQRNVSVDVTSAFTGNGSGTHSFALAVPGAPDADEVGFVTDSVTRPQLVLVYDDSKDCDIPYTRYYRELEAAEPGATLYHRSGYASPSEAQYEVVSKSTLSDGAIEIIVSAQEIPISLDLASWRVLNGVEGKLAPTGIIRLYPQTGFMDWTWEYEVARPSYDNNFHTFTDVRIFDPLIKSSSAEPYNSIRAKASASPLFWTEISTQPIH